MPEALHELQARFLKTAFDANALRALAEAADGIRNEPACIIANPDTSATGPEYLVVPRALADLRGWPCIISVHTDDNPKPVPPAQREALVLRSERELTFESGRAIDINQCDAIFTSLSAVEKFVVPYYARMRGLDRCESLRRRFAGDLGLVAMVHLPGSVEDTARFGGGTGMFVATARDKEGKLTLSALP